MSIKLMTIVWEMPIAHVPKMVLLCLADNASDDGHCYPSISTIVRKTSLSERAVQSNIRWLAEQGHITIRERVGRSSTYGVHPRTACTPAAGAPPHAVHPTPAPDAPPPPQRVRGRGAPRAPRTVIEPSEEPKDSVVAHAREQTQPEPSNSKLTAEAALAIPLIEAGVQVTSMHPTLVAWVADGFTLERVKEALALARQQKPEPQPIAANYLDRILRAAPRGPPAKPKTKFERLTAHLEKEDQGFG